jgi:hypothetical protein
MLYSIQSVSLFYFNVYRTFETILMVPTTSISECYTHIIVTCSVPIFSRHFRKPRSGFFITPHMVEFFLGRLYMVSPIAML